MPRAVSALIVLLALCPAAALAKAKPVPKPKPLPPVRYVCEDGTRLALVYSAPGVTPATAVLRILGTGTEIALDRAESADGGRYSKGPTEFWDKGATATYTQAGTVLSCRAKR